MKWRISGQRYKHLTRFQDSYCLSPQLILRKRLTVSTASIFVTEGLFVYIYFLLSEENNQNRISRAGEEYFSNDFALFVETLLLNPIPHWGGGGGGERDSDSDSALLQIVFFITSVRNAAERQNLVTSLKFNGHYLKYGNDKFSAGVT